MDVFFSLVLLALPSPFSNPANPWSLVQILEKRSAIYHLLVGNARIAAEQFQEFADRRAEDRLALAGQITALTKIGEHELAISACDRYVKLSPHDSPAHTHRGVNLLRLGRSEEAVKEFDKAIPKSMERDKILINRGRAYAGMGDQDHAIEDFSAVLKMMPGSIDALRGRAEAFRQKEDVQGCLADFGSLIWLVPHDAWARMQRAWVEMQISMFQPALEDLDQALLDGETKAYVYRGMVKLKMHDYEDCLHDLNEAVRHYPGSVAAYSHRGMAAAFHGDYAQAITDCTLAMWLEPTHAQAYCNRAAVFILLHRLDRATSDCEAALALDPECGQAQLLLSVVSSSRSEHLQAVLLAGRAWQFRKKQTQQNHCVNWYPNFVDCLDRPTKVQHALDQDLTLALIGNDQQRASALASFQSHFAAGGQLFAYRSIAQLMQGRIGPAFDDYKLARLYASTETKFREPHQSAAKKVQPSSAAPASDLMRIELKKADKTPTSLADFVSPVLDAAGDKKR